MKNVPKISKLFRAKKDIVLNVKVVLYLDIIRPELRDNLFTDGLIWLLSQNIFVHQLDKSQQKQRSLT